jgi:hypothetical protein
VATDYSVTASGHLRSLSIALKNEEGERKGSARKRAIAKYVNAAHLDTTDECHGSYILPLASGSSE